MIAVDLVSDFEALRGGYPTYADEQCFVWQLVLKAAIEALNEGVGSGLVERDVVAIDPRFLTIAGSYRWRIRC
jgi:hypothetical protein